MKTASVIINNYNYGRYLKCAVDSVLAQTRMPVDVVVVDDGSTDDSVDIIASYGDRIIPVLKRNGGQGSAFNAGFGLARGDVVFFLDADDALLPNAVASVLEHWRPGVAMVHYPMRLIDRHGETIGTHPGTAESLADGDVRDQILRTGSFPTTISSGLAFSRAVLKAGVMPVDEVRFRMATDGYLVRAAGLQGPVQALYECLAVHRRHGANDSTFFADSDGMLRSIRKQMHFREMEASVVSELAAKLGLHASSDMLDRDAHYLFHCILSVALDPSGHPGPGESPGALWKKFIRASWKSSSPTSKRALDIGVTTAALVLPNQSLRRLLQYRNIPETRPVWMQLMYRTILKTVAGLGKHRVL